MAWHWDPPGCSRVSPVSAVWKGLIGLGGFYWLLSRGCGGFGGVGEGGWERGGVTVIHVLPSVSRAFRMSTRTPLRCDVQSPSSRGNLCPLSCGWGRAHWPCCWRRICSGMESLQRWDMMTHWRRGRCSLLGGSIQGCNIGLEITILCLFNVKSINDKKKTSR